ncbi:hypothetical protein RCL1_007972 [Eukaryota sp. TZLM3-RCL]
MLSVQINGHVFQGLLDSGASVSTVTEDLVYKGNIQTCFTNTTLTTADQRMVTARKAANCQSTVKLAVNVTNSSELIVLPGIETLIIGRDVLNSLGLLTPNLLIITFIQDVDVEELAGTNCPAPPIINETYVIEKTIREISINLEEELQTIKFKKLRKVN